MDPARLAFVPPHSAIGLDPASVADRDAIKQDMTIKGNDPNHVGQIKNITILVLASALFM